MAKDELEIELAKVRAEWLLELRKQESIKAQYEAQLAQLNETTNQALAPIARRINELAEKERELESQLT